MTITNSQFVPQLGYPECHISVNKNRLKVYPDGKIYIQNGSEFQLEFHNKSSLMQKTVIKINGKSESHGLVLRPGEHFYLDRFMDVDKKFKFDTYEVDDVPETQSAIKNNGTVEIEFFAEEKPAIACSTYFDTHSGGFTTTYSNNIASSDGNTQMYGNTLTSRGMSKNLDVDYKGPAVFCATGSMDFASSEASTRSAKRMKMQPDTVLTGRVEQGGKSSQKFKDVHYNFAYYANTTVSFHLVPIENKPAEMYSTQVRRYCTECGRKVKSNWNNCPGCGTKI